VAQPSTAALAADFFTEDGQSHEPGVFYCKDAFEGLETMERLIDPERRLPCSSRSAVKRIWRWAAPRRCPHIVKREPAHRSSLNRLRMLLSGASVFVKELPLEMVLKHLSRNELYRLSWGAKNTHGAEWDKLKAEFDARLEKMTREALRLKWLKPQGVYGFFPCQSNGDELIVYDPETVILPRPMKSRVSHVRASLMMSIWPCPIILPQWISGKWMWSPSRCHGWTGSH